MPAILTMVRVSVILVFAALCLVATAKKPGGGGGNKPEKPEKPEGGNGGNGGNKPEKPEKPEGGNGGNKPEKPEKPNKELMQIFSSFLSVFDDFSKVLLNVLQNY